MSTFMLRAFATATLVFAAGTAARADQNNYYVHFTASNMQDGWITSGSIDGTTLVPPAGACGMVFEYVDDSSFILPYDVAGPVLPDGNIEILIGTCNKGGVSIDGIGMPSGWDGAIEIEDAYGYWVDGNHNKLIYKHSCAPHCSVAKNFYGGHGRHFVSELLVELKPSLTGKQQIRPLNVLLTMSDRHLRQLSYDLTTAILARRAFTAGPIENSVRKQEDDAQAKLLSAISQLGECRASQGRGDLKSAAVSCDGALTAVSLARAATETAEAWLPKQ